MNELGERIRKQRHQLSHSLKQVSGKTGLSISYLSEIERGVRVPSISSIRNIQKALGLSLFSLLANEDIDSFKHKHPMERQSHNYISKPTLVKKGQRKRIGYPGQKGFYELMTPDLNRQLEVLYIKREPGESLGTEPFIDPPGEKCCLMLSGREEVRIGGEVFQLEAGDCLSYPANLPISWKRLGDEVSEMILIITPPGI